jgi:hypothetical protein
MRVPEQSAVVAWAVLTALAAAAIGCAAPPPVEVTWDDREDLSRFHTWDWISGHAVFVRAPDGDATRLEERLSALIADTLRERGLQRTPGKGEIRVAAVLVATRSYESFRRARALQTLYSFHDIGGFEVQGEDLERRPVDRCRVTIYITGPHQERILWQGASQEPHSDGCAAHLDGAVTGLLERFPGKAEVADPQR